MNYLHHPNLLVQFWAACNTEFDKILDSFVRREGWLFQDLGLAAKKSNIGAIHRCVCTVVNGNQGQQERMDHFVRVNYTILDAAKTQWLVPWRNYVIDPSKGIIPPFLKRQLGGFFLLYMLYINQPLPNRYRKKQPIIMDARDLIAMHVFNATMHRLPKANDQFRELARQLVVIFNDMVISEAFEFSSVNDTFVTPCLSVQQLLASKLCIFTKTIYTLKDLRDQLYYITHHESKKVFRSLVSYGRFLPQQKTPSKSKMKSKGSRHDSVFPPKDKKWSTEEILKLKDENDIGKIAHSVTCILKSLDFGPILTKQRMLGTADNLLDKELNIIAKTHSNLRNITESNVRKVREHRRVVQDAVLNKSLPPVILRKYLSDNYDWVQDVIHQKEINSMELPAELELLGDEYIPEEVEVVDTGSDEDGDEWLTEDENDADEGIVYTPISTNQNIAISSRNSSSPSKRSHRFLSMPTIL